jgi:acyl-CoA hydrolase
MDTDIVVTEFGAADLRGRSHQERAEALIAISPPNHGAALRESWAAFAAKF